MKTKIGNMNEILATRSRSVFKYRINFLTIGYDKRHVMNRWCEENCEGLWHSETYYSLYWQFELEQDAMMFMLRWATDEGNKLK